MAKPPETEQPKQATETELKQSEKLEAARANLRAALESTFSRFSPEKTTVRDQASDVGSVGKLIGDVQHHAGNIATIAIGGLLILILITIIGMFAQGTMDEKNMDGMKTIVLALIGLMGTILGYIFGRGAAKGN